MNANNVITPSLYSQIKDLICTSRPYYALQNLQQLTDTLFQAEVVVENYYHSEHSIISLAEAGRHLAILGSCALAANNTVKAKHYYLACCAELEHNGDVRQSSPTQSGQSVRLICRAELLHLDKKTGSVATSIQTADGVVIYDLRVGYKVIHADLFGKLFKGNYIDNTAPAPINPYAAPMPLHTLVHAGDQMTASLGIIRKEQCVGHFDYYPALPVAILSSTMLELAGEHLRHLTKTNALAFTIHTAQLKADSLAFAGEEVSLKCRLLGKGLGTYTFCITAENSKGVTVGSIETIYEVHG